MLRALGILVVALATVGGVPRAAEAATVAYAGGVLTYVAAPGQVNRVVLDEPRRGLIVLSRVRGDTDPLIGNGCAATRPARLVCRAVTRIVVDLGTGDDSFDGSRVLTVPQAVDGGAGADSLVSGGRPDVLSGGDGNDFLAGNDGADTFSGGPGVDRVGYRRNGPLTITLDGMANDGVTGGRDLVGPDVENVYGAARFSETVTIVGDAGPNLLIVAGGHGVIIGGAGSDVLVGGLLSDTIDARDGYQDRVVCRAGADTALVDQFDVVRSDCESVQRSVL